MAFINFLFPRKIRYPDTKYNRDIVVIDYWSSATLLSGNLIESGSIMSHIWGRGIKKLLPSEFKPHNVLLLGLGGGSNATLIHQKYPQAQITGVDIDPFMIKIGKKFFGLNKIKNLKLVVADALDFVNQLQPSQQFDLTLLDCFLGENIPPQLEDLGFLQKLKNHSRYVLINRLWWYHHRKKALRFMKTLSPKFFFVKTHTRTNTIISLV